MRWPPPRRAVRAARRARGSPGATLPGHVSARPVRGGRVSARPVRGGRVSVRPVRGGRVSARAFLHLIVLPVVGALAACGWGAAWWTDNDHREIYASTLEALREAIGADTLVVDPSPTFLVADESGVFRMGDRNRFGDPALSGAITALPGAEPCRIEGPDEGCSAETARFAAVSEALPGHGRDAALLVAHVDLATGAVRHRFVRLRKGYGGWRVTSMEEGDEARPLR